MATVSYLESQRLAHAQLEEYGEYLTNLLVPPQSKIHRDRLATEAKASDLTTRMVDRSKALLETYDDPDGLRKAEMDVLMSSEGGANMEEFYQRLAKIKEYHRKYGGSTNTRASDVDPVDFTELEGGGIIDGRDFLDRMFTGEESLGRYLDLVLLHEQYNNLPGQGYGSMKRVNYLQYLDEVDQFSKIPKEKKGEQYLKYLRDLLDYVESFYRRAVPLQDFEGALQKGESEFDKKWPEGQVDGWDVSDTKESNDEDSGVWCHACQRHYAKQTVYDSHLSSKKHIKAVEKMDQNPSSINQANGSTNGNVPNGHGLNHHATSKASKNRLIALVEYQLNYLLSNEESPLATIRADTKSNVERKQALTDRERQLEIEEQEERERREAEEAARAAENADKNGDGDGSDEEGDDEEKIYNPLKLPLGWDGKPIPYWLYKLHGLGVEYRCEICNHTYMGRKNFDRHFQESRHSFGMRALGLPNTKHFHEITKIEDALALAAKLKSEGQAELFRAEHTEELEDSEGNVYSRKVYEDLRKQGLLQ